MNTRPKSVTIISWFLVVSGGLSAITALAMRNNPTTRELMAKNLLPPSAQYAIMAVGLLVMITCGLAMLSGNGRARTTYVAWTATNLAFGLATSPFKTMLIPSAIFFLVVTLFLYRPAANDFFASTSRPVSEPSA